jgi:hypothetical protein
MFSSFVSDVRGKSHALFASTTERLLALAEREGCDATQVQRVVDVLRGGALPSLTELPGMMLRAEAALYAAGLAIAGARRAGGERHGLSVLDATQALGAIAHELTLRVGVDQVASSLERYLPRLGVHGAGLAILPRGAELHRLEWVWTWGAGRVHWWRAGPGSRESSPRASVVMPLCFEDELLGVASFEVGLLHGVALETLRPLLGSALAHAVPRRS